MLMMKMKVRKNDDRDALPNQRTVKKKDAKKEVEQIQRSVQDEGTSSISRRYPKRLGDPSGEWWKTYILPSRKEEHANVVLLDGRLTIYEAV